MPLTESDAESLVDQLQGAHRLAAAFYQRIFPWFDKAAADFGCHFSSWGPLYTHRPGVSSTAPSRKWKWDFLPLYAFEINYERLPDSSSSRGGDDVGIRFRLLIEDSFKPERRKAEGISGSPSALKLPKGEGVVEVYVLRPDGSLGEELPARWMYVPLPQPNEEVCSDSGNVSVWGKSVRLAEVVSDPAVLFETLRASGLIEAEEPSS